MIVRLRIHGRVQGVWYRGWLVEKAAAHSVDGWVRNRADGTVEAVLAGDEAKVRALIAHCHEGPKLARVTSIDVLPIEERPPPGFVQLPTARGAISRSNDELEGHGDHRSRRNGDG